MKMRRNIKPTPEISEEIFDNQKKGNRLIKTINDAAAVLTMVRNQYALRGDEYSLETENGWHAFFEEVSNWTKSQMREHCLGYFCQKNNIAAMSDLLSQIYHDVKRAEPINLENDDSETVEAIDFQKDLIAQVQQHTKNKNLDPESAKTYFCNLPILNLYSAFGASKINTIKKAYKRVSAGVALLEHIKMISESEAEILDRPGNKTERLLRDIVMTTIGIQIPYYHDKSLKKIPELAQLIHRNTNTLSRYRIDLYIPSLHLWIEKDGQQHEKPIEYFGGKEHAFSLFQETRRRDRFKEQFATQHGLHLVRIYPEWEKKCCKIEACAILYLELKKIPALATLFDLSNTVDPVLWHNMLEQTHERIEQYKQRCLRADQIAGIQNGYH